MKNKFRFLGMLMMGAMLLSGVMFTACKDDDDDDDGNDGKIDPSTIAATNLIAYFPFESEGEAVQKANNTITFSKKVGAATFVTGRRGKAFQGSTSESYLEYNVTAASPIHSMDEFTFAAWIKTPVTTSGAAAIFSLNGGDATMGSIKILQESQALGDSVDMKLYLYDSEGEWHGQELRKNKPQFLNDKWYHFVAVYNKTISKMQ
ncbi:MAG TPA: LamG-like jellyroll fold domain-containing protein, partial [Bacteroidales bacterium]|nr:LamG-like jellyroll fold domain-containing protein [Bacteroidales bacterium]